MWIWTSTITEVGLSWHQQTDIAFSIFHVPSTTLFAVYFHTVSSVFRTSIYAVFVIDCTRKQALLIKWFKFVFTKDLPSISQTYKLQRLKRRKSIVPWVTWYTLSCKIFFFFFEVYFEAPKMFTNQLKNIFNGLHFCVCSFTKDMLLYKYFSRFSLGFVL